MSKEITIVIGIILVMLVIATGYGAFETTTSKANQSLFNPDDSLFQKAKNPDSIEQSDYPKNPENSFRNNYDSRSIA